MAIQNDLGTPLPETSLSFRYASEVDPIANTSAVALPEATLSFTLKSSIITWHAEDDELADDHGTDYANWVVDAGSSKGSSGITLVVDDASDLAYLLSAAGLTPNVNTHLRVIVSASSGTFGTLLVDGALSGIEAVGGGNLTIPTTVGTHYIACSVKNTAAHDIYIYDTGGTNGASVTFTFEVLGAKSGEKLGVVGDRTGGFNSTEANACNSRLDTLDPTNVVATGDQADTATDYPTTSDTLKNNISGSIFPVMGNHDYDVDRETEWISYYGTSGWNSGSRYYKQNLTNISLHMHNDQPNDPDNGSGNTGSAADHEASVAGQYLKNEALASAKTWRIAMMHYPPYNSNGSTAGNQMPFTDWGVSMFIGGHNHNQERIYREESGGQIMYITCARSGGSSHGTGSALSGTEYQSTEVAVGLITATATELWWELYADDGALLDRVKAVASTAPAENPVGEGPDHNETSPPRYLQFRRSFRRLVLSGE